MLTGAETTDPVHRIFASASGWRLWNEWLSVDQPLCYCWWLLSHYRHRTGEHLFIQVTRWGCGVSVWSYCIPIMFNYGTDLSVARWSSLVVMVIFSSKFTWNPAAPSQMSLGNYLWLIPCHRRDVLFVLHVTFLCLDRTVLSWYLSQLSGCHQWLLQA